MKWPQDVLQRKPVDRGDFVVEVFVAEAGLSEASVYLIGSCVGVRNASYPTGSVSDGFDAVQEFGNYDACLAAARTGHEAHVPRLRNSRALLTR
jgi:hypothetical protein